MTSSQSVNNSGEFSDESTIALLPPVSHLVEEKEGTIRSEENNMNNDDIKLDNQCIISVTDIDAVDNYNLESVPQTGMTTGIALLPFEESEYQNLINQKSHQSQNSQTETTACDNVTNISEPQSQSDRNSLTLNSNTDNNHANKEILHAESESNHKLLESDIANGNNQTENGSQNPSAPIADASMNQRIIDSKKLSGKKLNHNVPNQTQSQTQSQNHNQHLAIPLQNRPAWFQHLHSVNIVNPTSKRAKFVQKIPGIIMLLITSFWLAMLTIPSLNDASTVLLLILVGLVSISSGTQAMTGMFHFMRSFYSSENRYVKEWNMVKKKRRDIMKKNKSTKKSDELDVTDNHTTEIQIENNINSDSPANSDSLSDSNDPEAVTPIVNTMANTKVTSEVVIKPPHQRFLHFVFIPSYKEETVLLEMALRSLAGSRLDSKQHVIPVLCFEEREGIEVIKHKANKLLKQFKNDFINLFASFHPPNLPEETVGKHSNIDWGFQQLSKLCGKSESYEMGDILELYGLKRDHFSTGNSNYVQNDSNGNGNNITSNLETLPQLPVSGVTVKPGCPISDPATVLERSQSQLFWYNSDSNKMELIGSDCNTVNTEIQTENSNSMNDNLTKLNNRIAFTLPLDKSRTFVLSTDVDNLVHRDFFMALSANVSREMDSRIRYHKNCIEKMKKEGKNIMIQNSNLKSNKSSDSDSQRVSMKKKVSESNRETRESSNANVKIQISQNTQDSEDAPLLGPETTCPQTPMNNTTNLALTNTTSSSAFPYNQALSLNQKRCLQLSIAEAERELFWSIWQTPIFHTGHSDSVPPFNRFYCTMAAGLIFNRLTYPDRTFCFPFLVSHNMAVYSTYVVSYEYMRSVARDMFVKTEDDMTYRRGVFANYYWEKFHQPRAPKYLKVNGENGEIRMGGKGSATSSMSSESTNSLQLRYMEKVGLSRLRVRAIWLPMVQAATGFKYSEFEGKVCSWLWASFKSQWDQSNRHSDPLTLAYSLLHYGKLISHLNLIPHLRTPGRRLSLIAHLEIIALLYQHFLLYNIIISMTLISIISVIKMPNYIIELLSTPDPVDPNTVDPNTNNIPQQSTFGTAAIFISLGLLGFYLGTNMILHLYITQSPAGGFGEAYFNFSEVEEKKTKTKSKEENLKGNLKEKKEKDSSKFSNDNAKETTASLTTVSDSAAVTIDMSPKSNSSETSNSDNKAARNRMYELAGFPKRHPFSCIAIGRCCLDIFVSLPAGFFLYQLPAIYQVVKLSFFGANTSYVVGKKPKAGVSEESEEKKILDINEQKNTATDSDDISDKKSNIDEAENDVNADESESDDEDGVGNEDNGDNDINHINNDNQPNASKFNDNYGATDSADNDGSGGLGAISRKRAGDNHNTSIVLITGVKE